MKTIPPLSTQAHCQPGCKETSLGRMTAAIIILCALPLAANADVALNALVASNGVTLADSDGDYHELIELYNGGTEPVDLEGYGISNDSDEPFQWVFPSVTLEPGEFLVVFATGKDRPEDPEELHTNFRISASGDEVLLTHPDGSLLDEIPPTEIPRDVAYARQPDGTGDWYFFDEPKMGEPNTGQGYHLTLEPVEFSHDGGFYAEPFQLELETEHEDATIYYTLDGSEPTRDSNTYEGPISVHDRADDDPEFSMIPTSHKWREPTEELQHATVVRAIAADDERNVSHPLTNTYWVDPDGKERYSLPVISINTDPDNLFSDHKGIYVPGDLYEPGNNATGNFYQRGPHWERPVHIEFYEPDGELGFSQRAGVRIHGEYSRRFPRKSLRLYARGGYGDSRFDHNLFAQSRADYPRHRRFILRNSGNDFYETLFRDAIAQELMASDRLDTRAYRPAIVFINGEYWGIHNIRERHDKHYFESKYGVNPEGIDRLHDRASVKEGDSDHFDWLWGYLEEHDLSDDSHYDFVKTQMDIDNFVDYQIANIYARNTDWPHNNLEYWRVRPEDNEAPEEGVFDGRWRWFLKDLDHGFAISFAGDWNAHAHDTLSYATREDQWSTFLLRELLMNASFRDRFIARFSAFIETNYAPERVVAKTDEMESALEPEIREHTDRWQYHAGVTHWEERVEVLRHFGKNRPDAMYDHLASFFELDDPIRVSVDTRDRGVRGLRINEVPVEDLGDEWEGRFFPGIPLRLEVTPAPGYQLDGWEGLPEAKGASERQTVEITPQNDLQLRPVLKDNPQAHSLSEAPYVFSSWPSDSDPGTYPANMMFMRNVVEDPEEDRDPELDVALPELWTHPYDLDNRSRIVGLGEDGFGFINTTWFQGYRHEGPWEDDHQSYLGGAVLALDTEDVDSAEVTWEAGTVLPNDREYALRLRYRVGNEGAFSDVLDDDGNPVEYMRSSEAGDTQVLGPVELPGELLGHPYVQLKWRYHYIDTGVEGQRAKLRVGGIVVRTEEQSIAEGLSFDGVHVAGQADNELIPFEVEAVDGDGQRDLSYSGPITVAIAEGPGELSGTVTREAVNGVARFDDLAVSEPGAYEFEATSPDLSAAVSEELQAVALEEILVPRYMQANPPHPNEDRVPYAFRLRITGLNPNATYRYANRIATVDEPSTQDGAGNNIFVYPHAFRRNTDTPAFDDDPATFSSFETDGAGTYEGWFITEPTGNERFEDEELHLRILLNDGAGGEENHFFLDTPSTAELRSFGEGADEATGLYADSPSEPRNFVFLYDNVEGEGRPIAGTFVEPGGQDVDERYVTFYEDEVWGEDGRWGTLLPNDLDEGVRRIEERDLADGSLVSVYTSEDGQWNGVDTRNPSGGAAEPLVLELEAEPAAGWLEVSLEPEAAADAGAQWRVEGEDWRQSGERVELEPGDYSVTFREVEGWVTPEAQDVTVDGGETARITAAYEDQPAVPDVRETSQEDAESAIRDAGFEVGEVTQEYHDTIPEGTVISLEPEPGAELDPGAAINLVVSLGPEPDDDHGASMKRLQSDVYEKVLPAGDAYAAGQEVYLRLKADDPIDPETLWVSAYGEDGRELYLPALWRPTDSGDDRDGWTVVTLPEPAHDGETFFVVADAMIPATGETVTREALFEMTDAPEAKETPDTALVEDDSVKPLPEMLADGASPVYRIAPGQVFDEPQTVRLPVEDDPGDLGIYYYSESPEHEGWYRGEQVIGWLVPDSVEIVEKEGETYLEFEVNHAGVMQLGRDVSAKLGGLGVSVTGRPTHWIALAALLALAAWAALPRKRQEVDC